MAKSQSTPAPARQRGGPAEEQSSATPAKANSTALDGKAAPGGVGATLRGMWDGATGWVGEHVDGAVQAVEGAWDTTRDLGKKASAIAGDSSVSAHDGKVEATTDLDTVMAALPASMQKAFQLDPGQKKEQNRAHVTYDRTSGQARVELPSLSLKGLDAGGVKAGRSELSGVTITIDRADQLGRAAASHYVGDTVSGWVFGEGDAKSEPKSQIHVARVVAEDVSVGGAAAKRLTLNNLDIHMGGKGSAPGGGGAGLVATFTVDGAVVDGLHAPGAGADQLGAKGLSASVDTGAHSATLGAESLSGKGVKAGGASLGSGEVSGLSATVKGTGMADATGSAKATKVALSGLDTSSVDLRGGTSTNVSVAHTPKDTKVGLGTTSVDGLSVGTAFSADHIDASAGTLGLHDGGVSVDAPQASGKGVKVAGGSAASASTKDLGVKAGKSGTHVQASRASASGVVAGPVKVERADTTGAHVDVGADGVKAGAPQVSASGVHAADASAGTLSAKNLTVNAGSKGAHVAADAATGTKLDGAGAHADELEMSGAALDVGPTGVHASVPQVDAAGFTSPVGSATSLGARDLALSQGGGATQASAGRLTGTSLTGAGASAGTLAAKDVAVTQSAAGTHASAAQLGGTKLAAAGATVDQADVRGATVDVAGGSTKVAVPQAAATGVKAGPASAGSLTARDVAVTQSATGTHASAGQLGGTKLAAGGATVDQADVTGASVDVAGGSTKVAVPQAAAAGVKAGPASAGSLAARDVAVTQSATGTHASAGQLGGTKLAGPGVSAAKADVTGASVDTGAGGTKAHVDKASADAVRVATSTPSTGKSKGGSGVDVASLVGAVDQADVTAKVPLVPGDKGLVTVDPGTTATAHAAVKDHALVPGATKVDLTKPLDGPLWTTGKGVYLEPTGAGQAKVEAAVGGWADQDLTDMLPGKPRTIPLDTRALAKAFTNGAPASGSNAATRDGGGLGDWVDLSKTSVNGSAHLDGKASSAGVSGTFAGSAATDNTLDFSADAAGNFATTFARVLVQNLQVDQGGTEASAGSASATGGKVNVQAGKGATNVTGTVDHVEVKDADARVR